MCLLNNDDIVFISNIVTINTVRSLRIVQRKYWFISNIVTINTDAEFIRKTEITVFISNIVTINT